MSTSRATVYYERQRDRLIFIESVADDEFWDRRWARERERSMVRMKSPFVQRETQRYLAPPARVLDAGCGLANTVFGLHHAGFEAYGIDFAQETIDHVNAHAPELNVSLADVRRLPFDDEFFDGIWSLGVIEHFYDGYDLIIQEARRTLKPGALLFLTVPSISPVRRGKIRLGGYPDVDEADLTRFYQFAFSPKKTAKHVSDMGFTLLSARGRGGYLGLLQESGALRPLLAPLYVSRNEVAIFLRRVADLALAPVSFHTMYYVFRKK